MLIYEKDFEIGGYFEIETYRLPQIHDAAMALNCGRNCLAFLIQKKKIKRLYIPRFICSAIYEICKRYNVKIEYYSIDEDWIPLDPKETDEWIYIVNYYGQLDCMMIKELKNKYPRMILDNAQAYFEKPINGIDTIYVCRKFFGVSDGAFLYSDITDDVYEYDYSYDRMQHILGRYERNASDFYELFRKTEEIFSELQVKKMSRLTCNLLHGIDYEYVEQIRTRNFAILNKELKFINKLDVQNTSGAYMYPLYIENGAELREKLANRGIYTPVLWPFVLELCNEDEWEYKMSNNIIPLPVDQRYNEKTMQTIVDSVLSMK